MRELSTQELYKLLNKYNLNINDICCKNEIKNINNGGYYSCSGVKVQDYVNNFLSDLVSTRWKEMIPNIYTFKDLYNHFKTKKNSKYSYRILFNDVEKLKWSSFRLKSTKSMIDLIKF